MRKFFEGVKTYEELRKAYKKLAMELHPDHGGTNEGFRAMADEYHKLAAVLKNEKGESVNVKFAEAEAEKFKKILDILLNLEGLEIELCGDWLWIGGDTMTNKDALKAVGCRWAPRKHKWYWAPEEQRHFRRYRGTKSMDEIRDKYGSRYIGRGKGFEKLSA